MWVKICGNTNLADAQLALDAGADALGFVFAESKRQVNALQVRAILQGLSRPVETIGVFANFSFDEIVKAVEESGVTGIQLHSGGDPALASRLQAHFAGRLGWENLRLIQVVHFGSDLKTQVEAAADPAIDAVLVDSRVGKLLGGTGVTFNWREAQSGFRSGSGLRLVAAGGLNPENVAEAIETLHPWGVDVVTGVEESPGRKSPEKIRAFVENARSAAHRMEIAERVEA
ncbi:phosphoribosylanthranilate isomerase [Silvibacterium acidisoli]|uniref:phosphoribosylanthranilate isomerase n=1 Tax=Acidobacteriaceae bacterium ZG23-2 TaxID=2883246 RepID=UPI00406BFBCC